jgi:NADH dehydrogenase FAD-containing subunit
LKDSKYSNIFALGDVAETLGPKMARAGLFQAEIVLANILEMIKGLPPSDTYKPLVSFEGAIKLTLGKVSKASLHGTVFVKMNPC